MMASSRAWLFCLMLYIIVEKSVALLPGALLVPVNTSQTFRIGVPFEVVCNAPSADLTLIIMGYYFRSEQDGVATTQPASNAFKTVVPTDNPLLLSCAYETFSSQTSPSSQQMTVVASAITAARAVPSVSAAYFDQPVNFTCEVDLDPTAEPPPGGNDYTFRWYDRLDNLVSEGDRPTYERRLDGDLTYRCTAAANNEVFIASDPVTVPELDYPPPTVVPPPSARFYFAGLTYTFECVSDADDVVTFTTYEWFLDSAPVATITNVNHYDLFIPDSSNLTNISCKTFISNASSPRGDDLTVTAMPSAVILPASENQEIKHGHPFELICNTSSVLIDIIKAFHFMGVADDGSSLNGTSPNSSYMATASQFQRYNYTCSYEIDGAVSPVSDNLYSLLATIITRVTTVPSMDQAYLWENVTFTCQVDTDPDTTPPVGGDVYTVRWFDGTGNLEAVTQEMTYHVVLRSSIGDFRCHAAVNNDLFVAGAPASVTALNYPPPTVVPPPSARFYFAGLTYTFECVSDADDVVTFTTYEWFLDSAPVATIRNVNHYDLFIPDSSNLTNISCKTSISTASSPRGDDLTVTGCVGEKRSIRSPTRSLTLLKPLDPRLVPIELATGPMPMATITSVNHYDLSIPDPPYQTNISCKTSIFTASVSSTAMPSAVILPASENQEIKHGHPFELICNTSSVLIDNITAFHFMGVADDGSSLNGTSPNSSYMATASQFQRYNYTCSYEIDAAVSPVSDNSYSLLATIITRVTTVPSMDQAYLGENVTFTCQVDTDPDTTPPVGGDVYTVRWFDGTGNLEAVTQDMTYHVVLRSSIGDFRCHAAVNNDLFVAGAPASVTALSLPQPTIIPPSPEHFVLAPQLFTCISGVPSPVAGLFYEWFLFGTSELVTPIDQHAFVLSNASRYEFSCETFIGSYSSPRSHSVSIIMTVPPPPSIRLLAEPSHYLVGTEYELECESDHFTLATQFCLKNVDIDVGCQLSIRFPFTAEETEQRLSCYMQLGFINTTDSPIVSIIGSGIVEISASVDSTTPYPGTNVTLTCSATLTTGYVESDVTFSWKDDDANLIAETKVVSQYVTIDMVKSFHCEGTTGVVDVTSDVLTVTARGLPQPTIIPPSPEHFVLAPQLFTCISGVPSPVAGLFYEWFLFGTSELVTPIDQHAFVLSNASRYEFSCETFIGSYSSPRSHSVSITMTVPPPPSIRLLAEPSHYLVGTEYELECESDHFALAIQFCLKNVDIDVGCQMSIRFSFTAEETEQRLSCYMQLGFINTTDSPFVSIIGSGIVEISASVDSMTPYPGTNVTLTCSATLTTGYVESDVTFSWKDDDANLIAETKVVSEYVTIDMVKSFHCEGTTGVVDVTSDVLTVTARDLPTPSIEVQNRPPDDNYEPGHFYPLICNSELEDLLTSYNWYSDGQLMEDVHTKHYLAQAMSYTHNYACTYSILREESPQSSSVTIATKSIVSVHVENNGLIATTLMPVFGSAVTLSCEVTIKPTATESPTYKWFERDTQAGTGQELTIVAYAGYNHPVVCQVTVGDEIKASDQVNITSREDLPSPEMSLTTHQVNEVLPRASYTLSCISSSLSLNTTITWYKDLSQLLCLHDLTLDITRYDPLVHDGQYTCEIAAFGMTARSGPTIMSAIAPGKQCTGSDLCSGQGEGYTGACRDQRCVCSDGYKARWKECVLI